MLTARCLICGCPTVDHPPYSLWWGSPVKYVRRAWWRHFIWSRI